MYGGQLMHDCECLFPWRSGIPSFQIELSYRWLCCAVSGNAAFW